ncbi:hypothetical protein Agub_g14104, partial [Astrephomene gubernaculifera]
EGPQVAEGCAEEAEVELGGEEEEEEEGGGAGAAEDPEVAKQRQLREAALRDRIGGRQVAEAPVRPLSDVAAKILARQRSLLERTRANAPVGEGPPAPAAAPPAAAPPTFNVRALMQSLAQSKQQQQQQQERKVGSAPAAAAAAASQHPEQSQPHVALELRLDGSQGAEEAGAGGGAVGDVRMNGG